MIGRPFLILALTPKTAPHTSRRNPTTDSGAPLRRAVTACHSYATAGSSASHAVVTSYRVLVQPRFPGGRAVAASQQRDHDAGGVLGEVTLLIRHDNSSWAGGRSKADESGLIS